MKTDYNLVKVTEENALLILEWRNQENIRSNMYDNNVVTLEAHMSWLKLLQSTDKMVAFIFQYKGRPVGVVSGSEREADPKKWIWGCYLGSPGSIPKIGTKMGLFAMEYFFEIENCDIVIGEMIKANTISHRFNLGIGFHVEKDIQIARKNGELVESVLLVQEKNSWLRNKANLFAKAFD
jgi:UDP-4-amino-4,6-dideoxy-N-acetyl-beta-L-altrosamine N-acetyltransferase